MGCKGSKTVKYREKQEIEYFLGDVLQEGDILAVNPALGTLSYLSKQDEKPRLLLPSPITLGDQDC